LHRYELGGKGLIVNILQVFERNLAVGDKAVQPSSVGFLGDFRADFPFVLNLIRHPGFFSAVEIHRFKRRADDRFHAG
jgi:hypothetical protein